MTTALAMVPLIQVAKKKERVKRQKEVATAIELGQEPPARKVPKVRRHDVAQRGAGHAGGGSKPAPNALLARAARSGYLEEAAG